MWSPSFSWLILGVLVAKLLQQHSPASSSVQDCAQGAGAGGGDHRYHIHPSQASILIGPSVSNCFKMKEQGDVQVSAKQYEQDSNSGQLILTSCAAEEDACNSTNDSAATSRIQSSCRSVPAALPERQDDEHAVGGGGCKSLHAVEQMTRGGLEVDKS